MGRPIIGFPNLIDDATLTGGSYESTLPRANVADRRPKVVARTTDDATASTQFDADLGSGKRVDMAALFGHNISLAGLVRFRAQTDGARMVELDAVTNLAGEFALGVYPESDYRVAAPANFDPNDISIACWTIMQHASNDGNEHTIIQPVKSGGGEFVLLRSLGGSIRANSFDGVTFTNAQVTVPYSAGDIVFAGLRRDGSDIYVYAANISTGDTSLAVASAADTNVLSGTFSIGIGQQGTGDLDGEISALITDDGSTADAITDRFNSGNGEMLESTGGWLDAHGNDLVLLVGNVSATLGAFTLGSADPLEVSDLDTVSFTASDEGFVIDSGFLPAYPDAYPVGAILWGEDVGGGTVTAESFAAGKRWPWFFVIDSVDVGILVRFLSFEIDDTANADGFVDIGRAFAGPIYETATGDVLQGAEFDNTDPSVRSVTDGGTFHFDEKNKHRTWVLDLGWMDDVENKTQILEMKRRVGRTGQLVFVPNFEDELGTLEQGMLCVMDETSPAVVLARGLYRQQLFFVEER